MVASTLKIAQYTSPMRHHRDFFTFAGVGVPGARPRSSFQPSGDQHAQQRDHAAKKPGPALLRRETARLLLSRRGLSRGTGLVPVGLRTDLWPG